MACIKEILKFYEGDYGQVVNFKKYEVSYSRNVCESVKVNIHGCLGVSSIHNHSRYHGLPVVLGRLKRDILLWL